MRDDEQLFDEWITYQGMDPKAYQAELGRSLYLRFVQAFGAGIDLAMSEHTPFKELTGVFDKQG